MDDMGSLYVDARIADIQTPDDDVAAGALLVDTGSELTWIRRDVLESAGVRARKRLEFELADGSVVVREVGYAMVRACGFETPDEVVFAEATDTLLLGARTLEGFPATVDLSGRRL